MVGLMNSRAWRGEIHRRSRLRCVQEREESPVEKGSLPEMHRTTADIYISAAFCGASVSAAEPPSLCCNARPGGREHPGAAGAPSSGDPRSVPGIFTLLISITIGIFITSDIISGAVA
jgi:hypothetical protein